MSQEARFGHSRSAKMTDISCNVFSDAQIRLRAPPSDPAEMTRLFTLPHMSTVLREWKATNCDPSGHAL